MLILKIYKHLRRSLVAGQPLISQQSRTLFTAWLFLCPNKSLPLNKVSLLEYGCIGLTGRVDQGWAWGTLEPYLLTPCHLGKPFFLNPFAKTLTLPFAKFNGLFKHCVRIC